jgi:cytochrome c oxidase assembly protein subunit 15
MLHRFATLVACCTLLLVIAGSLVTSTGSGLSVPDWPTTYGWSIFTFPLSKMAGGIFFEHTHRLIASSVGFLTIILAGWIWWRDDRRWMRRLGLAALACVIAQGVLGGLTVLFFLPPALSIAHASLAEIFFCLAVSLALFTSPGWRSPQMPSVDDVRLRQLAATTTVVIFGQILVGATMRHLGAGLAIPDFPLAFGRVLPPDWSTPIVVHFAHRVGGLLASAAIFATTVYIVTRHRDRAELVGPAVAMAGLVLIQIVLGGLTVLSGKVLIINTAHVATGALILSISLVVTLRTFQVRFTGSAERIPNPPERAVVPSAVGARA